MQSSQTTAPPGKMCRCPCHNHNHSTLTQEELRTLDPEQQQELRRNRIRTKLKQESSFMQALLSENVRFSEQQDMLSENARLATNEELKNDTFRALPPVYTFKMRYLVVNNGSGFSGFGNPGSGPNPTSTQQSVRQSLLTQTLAQTGDLNATMMANNQQLKNVQSDTSSGTRYGNKQVKQTGGSPWQTRRFRFRSTAGWPGLQFENTNVDGTDVFFLESSDSVGSLRQYCQDRVVQANNLYSTDYKFDDSFWVVVLNLNGFLGVASLPTYFNSSGNIQTTCPYPSIAPNNSGRTNFAYIGYVTLGSYDQPNPQSNLYGLGSTLAHEIGHAFGLMHTFEDQDYQIATYAPDIPQQYMPNFSSAGFNSSGKINEAISGTNSILLWMLNQNSPWAAERNSWSTPDGTNSANDNNKLNPVMMENFTNIMDYSTDNALASFSKVQCLIMRFMARTHFEHLSPEVTPWDTYWRQNGAVRLVDNVFQKKYAQDLWNGPLKVLNWLLSYIDEELMVTKQRQEDLRTNNIFNFGSQYDYDNFNNPYPQIMDIEGWKTLRTNWRSNFFAPAKQKYNDGNTGWPRKTQYILVAIRAGGQALYYHEIFVNSLGS